MGMLPAEEGLSVVQDLDLDLDEDDLAARDTQECPDAEAANWRDHEDTDLETLRDEFVDAFNGRDLDSLVGLIHPAVESPDFPGDGVLAVCREFEEIWERAPAVILTRAFLEGTPCAMAWLPDEEGCWARAALVCLDHDGDRITLVGLPDDPDALAFALTEEPTGEELDEWADWAEWERGEETIPHPRR